MFDERDLGRGIFAVANRGVFVKAAAALAVVGVASLLMLAPFGGTSKPQAACLPLDPGQAVNPNPRGPLRATQIAWAKLIDQVAVERGLPGQATLIALMTALVESDLQNLAYGDADSVGLFQQRPGAGWGDAKKITSDPVYSIKAFFGGKDAPDPPGLVDINGWPSMAYGDAAQAVQVSAFPDRYALREQEAREIAAQAGIDLTRPGNPYAGRAGTVPSGGIEGVAQDDDCGSGEGLISGKPVNGVWPPEEQSVTDPTGTGGMVTPRTAAWVAQARQNLGTLSMSCWDAHVWNPTSDHPRGKACDLMVGADARRSSPARARGDEIANWAVKTAGQTGVRYVIWYGKIWSARRGTWIPYNGGGVYSPTDATGGHYDHVHVSVY
ncbi:hypothetical protein ACWCOV_22300 [Kribbella sp. NPDC002412]